MNRFTHQVLAKEDSNFFELKSIVFQEFFFVFYYFSKMQLKLNQLSNSLDMNLLSGKKADSPLTYPLKLPIYILKRFFKIILCICFLIITFLWLLNFNEESIIETDFEIKSESGLRNEVLFTYYLFIYLFSNCAVPLVK